MKARHRTHGEAWRKFAIKMLLNTRCLGSEGVSPGIYIQEPLLIGSTTALVGMRPKGPHLRSPSLCRRRHHFWTLIKMLAMLKEAEG